MEKACKKCYYIIAQGSVCPVCGSKELTEKWSGYVIILNPEKSQIVKYINAKVPGKYAVHVRG